MKVYKGSVVTCDGGDTVARYLVEESGRIAFVGDRLPEQYAGAPGEDLGPKALLPSFADTHNHFLSFATFSARPDILSARSNAEVMAMLSDYLREHRRGVAMAFGASAHAVREGRLITREELDRVSRTRPILLAKYDGHACVVNSALLGMLGGGVSRLRGFDAAGGEMRQEAFFAVSDFATRSVSAFEAARNLQRAVDAMAARGIGMVHTVSGVGFPRDLDVTLETIAGRSERGGFQTRLFFQTMDVDKAVRRGLPRVGGCFATALDGSFGSMDAALLQPYRGTGSRGVLFYSDEAVADFCRKANRRGLQIEMHAIGDAAFRQAARAIKAALDDCPRQDHRHGIIHACLTTEEGVGICARYGIQLAVQPVFFDWPQEPPQYHRGILGDRTDAIFPLRTLLDAGVRLTLGSDAPCSKPDPILWIHHACNHPTPGQSATVAEALRMATRDAYRGSFDERERGSLEAGKIADMVILSENPYSVPVRELKRLKVEQLLLAGRPYEAGKTSALAMLAKGLIGGGRI